MTEIPRAGKRPILCCSIMLLAMVMHRVQLGACSSVLVADFRMARMVELSSRPPYCKIHTDRGDIQRMLLASDTKKVRQVPRESVTALEEVCNEASGISGELQGGLGFIYPGTKWCGPGNIASNFSDVGRYEAEDQCCREHDLCPNVLLPGECRRGLCNRGAFTRSHCDCDARFRRCLQSLNTAGSAPSSMQQSILTKFYNGLGVSLLQCPRNSQHAWCYILQCRPSDLFRREKTVLSLAESGLQPDGSGRAVLEVEISTERKVHPNHAAKIKQMTVGPHGVFCSRSTILGMYKLQLTKENCA